MANLIFCSHPRPQAPSVPALLPQLLPQQQQMLEQALSALFTHTLHGDFQDLAVEASFCCTGHVCIAVSLGAW